MQGKIAGILRSDGKRVTREITGSAQHGHFSELDVSVKKTIYFLLKLDELLSDFIVKNWAISLVVRLANSSAKQALKCELSAK